MSRNEECWERAARLESLDPEYPVQAKIGDKEIAICIVDGTVYAVDNICSHAFARLSDGYVEGMEIFCPLHQGSFDLRTGAAVAQPCEAPIDRFDVKVEDGDVFIKLGGAA